MDEVTMRRLRAAAISAGLVGTLGLSGCSAEEVQDVYGPPPFDDGDIDNVETVYGPPEWADDPEWTDPNIDDQAPVIEDDIDPTSE